VLSNHKERDFKREESLLKEIVERYDEQLSPYYAHHACGLMELLIHWKQKIISIGVEAANHGIVEKFNVGVIQT
jgi:hypothetical protein